MPVAPLFGIWYISCNRVKSWHNFNNRLKTLLLYVKCIIFMSLAPISYFCQISNPTQCLTGNLDPKQNHIQNVRKKRLKHEYPGLNFHKCTWFYLIKCRKLSAHKVCQYCTINVRIKVIVTHIHTHVHYQGTCASLYYCLVLTGKSWTRSIWDCLLLGSRNVQWRKNYGNTVSSHFHAPHRFQVPLHFWSYFANDRFPHIRLEC